MKAASALVTRPADLSISLQLTDHLRKCLAELGPEGRILHLAHSGGAIITYLVFVFYQLIFQF